MQNISQKKLFFSITEWIENEHARYGMGIAMSLQLLPAFYYAFVGIFRN